MKKLLVQIKDKVSATNLFGHIYCLTNTENIVGNTTGITGDASGIFGDVSGLMGNVTNVFGCTTGICGNLNNCRAVDECSSKICILDLVKVV